MSLLWVVWVVVACVGCGDAPQPEEAVTDKGEAPSWGAEVGKADGVSADRASQVALPAPGGQGAQAAWGGPSADHWAPEAVLANAASQALNAAWARPGVRDVVVAIPAVLEGSGIHPYGDGQSNAAASLGSWGAPRPPVVATLSLLEGGAAALEVTLDRELPVASEEVSLELADGVTLTAVGARSPEGDLRVAWEVSTRWPSIHEGLVARVRPQGWGDGFPLHLFHPAQEVDDLLEEMTPAQRQWSGGRTLPDPEDVSSQTRPPEGTSVVERLMSHSFGPGYNSAPFTTPHVHAEHPSRAQDTAVGGSLVWVSEKPASPFKQVYICFEGRQLQKEAALGVPTGSGWHQIGDPAESLVHSLERGPMLTGWAVVDPLQGAALPPSGHAYGLRDVATFRVMWPGEALVTSAGPQAVGGSRATFHWYAFPTLETTCGEIWIHDCAPHDGLGFSCEAPTDDAPKGDAKATVAVGVYHNQTQLGDQLYMVGALPELGGWDPDAAVALDPSSWPVWSAEVTLPADQEVEFKFIIKTASGEVIWEPGPNRSLSTPTGGGALSYDAAWSR
ncbi:MAG: hypothetical protein CMH57_08870 [Myxococcales bacterium]|nr:hypothetical protein [Myxococcales bacterium]